MIRSLMVLFLAGSVATLVACSDDAGSTSTTSSSSTSSMGNGGSGGDGGMGTGGMGTGGMGTVGNGTGGNANACQDDCETFWACTQLDYMGMKICPGLDPSFEQPFIDECLNNPQCGSIGGLVGDGTDPDQCNSGVDTIKSFASEFAAVCDG